MSRCRWASYWMKGSVLWRLNCSNTSTHLHDEINKADLPFWQGLNPATKKKAESKIQELGTVKCWLLPTENALKHLEFPKPRVSNYFSFLDQSNFMSNPIVHFKDKAHIKKKSNFVCFAIISTGFTILNLFLLLASQRNTLSCWLCYESRASEWRLCYYKKMHNYSLNIGLKI